MPEYINTLPIKQFIIYLLIGGLLHFIFHLLSVYLIPVLSKRESRLVLLWQRLQIVVWVVFFILFFSSVLRANPVLTLSISFFVFLTGWSYWTQLFAGVIIKFSNTLKVEDSIATDSVSGNIRKIYYTHTEIINKKGELISIPNTKLNRQVIKHVNDAKTLNPFIYKLKPKASVTYDKLYQKVLNCPYFTANKEVKLDKKNKNTYMINAMLLDESFKEKAIEYFEGK